MRKKIATGIVKLQKFSDQWWYLPTVSSLAALDIFVIMIPTDALLISSVFLQPKKWIKAFIWVTTGSALGAILLGITVQSFGDGFIHDFAGSAIGSESWVQTKHFIDLYGGYALAFFAFGPLPVQPAVLISAAALMPVGKIFLAVWLGRAVKYFFFAWAVTHAPKLLDRIWGIRKELKDLKEAHVEH